LGLSPEVDKNEEGLETRVTAVVALLLETCEAGVSIKPGAKAPGPEPIKGKAHEMGGSLSVKARLSSSL
jgi:hypothetical protein